MTKEQAMKQAQQDAKKPSGFSNTNGWDAHAKKAYDAELARLRKK